MPALLLASSSPWRRQLLERLRVPFECASPDIDESPLAGENPEQLGLRLAEGKALALAAEYPNHLIIGSDQVLLLDGQPVSKPGTAEGAFEQLRRCSGRRISFYTALVLLNTASGRLQRHCEPFHVHFRELDDARIRRYIALEQPWDCAGSFRVEGLGISLFSALEGRDPNSLIGLPLIALCDMLAEEGVVVP